MAITAAGVTPRPIDPGVVRGLFGDRLGQSALWAKALEMAPLIDMGQTSGTMPIDGTYRGIDLAENPKAATEVALTGTDYADISVKLDTETFALARYIIGKFEHSYLAAGKLEADNGVEIEEYVARIFADKAAALHYYHTITAITTTGNYATGYQADGGNITSASFDLIGLCRTAGDQLIKAQAWDGVSALNVVMSNDVLEYFQSLTQVRNRIGTANDTYITPSMAGEWFAEYLNAPVNFVLDRGFYRNASQTVTPNSTGMIAFYVPKVGKQGRGHVCTMAASALPGGLMDLRTESNNALAGGGQNLHADAFYDVHVENIEAAGSTSGYLAHTLLS